MNVDESHKCLIFLCSGTTEESLFLTKMVLEVGDIDNIYMINREKKGLFSLTGQTKIM